VNQLELYAHALRAARPRQLAARFSRCVSRRRFPAAAPRTAFRPVDDLVPLWRSAAFARSDAVAGAGVVDVLGSAVPFPPPDWSLPDEPRLRRFHLHYADEVLGWARRGEEESARASVGAWIRSNPPKRGDAWHPYVVSQRIGNWVAAASLAPSLLDGSAVESLSRQARFLARNIEDDVLGNHVIANARALVLAGAALEDDVFLRRGLDVLRREVPDQILADGGHYERSPLYHLLVLRDLLEVRVAADAGWLDEPIRRMEAFAAALTRPDGLPAPFNDALLELAPTLELPKPVAGTTVFEETGYTVVRDGATWLVFDCGPPAPSFLPAHAHADVLSFQLWQDGIPIVVDPGTSTYEAGPQRDRERSTAAHSTVSVDGRDQFELWGAFRSGPLPSVRMLGALEAEISYGPVTHRRRVDVGAEVVVSDEVQGGRVVEARLPLAGPVELAADGWETGSEAQGLDVRRELPVAVRRGRVGDWRIRSAATL
jgi:uncharacterized heparinase superfamily protein